MRKTQLSLLWDDVPIFTFLVRCQFIPNHTNHDLIRDEISSVHDLLCLFTELSLPLDLGSEHISSCEVTDTVFG